MKKARPNSVVVLPSHHGHAQFKDKPVLGDGTLGSGGMSGGNSGGLAGRMTLRRMILTAGGLLFAYITVTTILGSGPGRERRGPVVTRPEADPYLDVPHDNNAGVNNGHRNSNSNKPPPVIKIDPIEEEKKDPWAEPVKQPGQDIHVDDSKPQQQQEKPPPPPPQKQLQEQPVVQEPDNSNKNNAGSDAGESEDEGESNVDEPVETESMLTIATKARQNSPVSYPDLLSAIRRERDYAIALIVREADMALKSDKVYSVTLKNQTAPSGDVHDYLSLSKYYWPNKKFASGLPYVRMDGHINPEIDTVLDYKLMRTMIREVHIMGMAYHFTGDSSYAEKCAMRLKEWFLDEATYMNPNINYGSLRKGEKLGARTGVLDMFTIFRVFDALHYLKQDPSWPQDLIPRLQEWFKRYVHWLETSSLAKSEREGKNNHGTYYDVQLIGIYLFLDRVEDARAIAQSALSNRLDIQITGKGEQPEELERKTSWYYSVFNLQALMTLARWGDDLGVDMWNHVGPQGQSIKKAIDFLLPYSLSDGKDWPVQNLKGFDMKDYLKCLQIAWVIYGDEKYVEAIKYLEPKVREVMDSGKIKAISTFMCDMSTVLEATKRGGQGMIWHWCLT